MIKLLFLALAIQISFSANIAKRDDDYILVCTQEPIDLAIIFDSSSSIYLSEFDLGKEFLQDFLGQFEIGDRRNDVRVSFLSYGWGIYKEHAFNLDTYSTKDDVIAAIGRVKHEGGQRTDTGAAIEHMRTVQMTDAVTRDWAEKVCIVFTDGNSQLRKFTKEQAEEARAQGIIMFAVGVGSVRESELMNIAGNSSRVLRVRSYKDLEGIKEELAKKSCVKKPRPTTTPRPKTDKTCGEDFPSDINFVFSPADLGKNATSWVTSVVHRVVVHHDFGTNFRYGAVTGSCPQDEGFALDKYQTKEKIKERLRNYDLYHLPGLVKRTTNEAFKKSRGGRDDARDVAVVFVDGYAPDRSLVKQSITDMVADGVKVYVMDPYNTGIEFDGALTIGGTGARDAAENLITSLCEWDL